jgi:hypothetical protein
MRAALLSAFALLAGCGEGREEAAQRIGAIDINPRKTFDTLRKSLGAHVEIRDVSDHNRQIHRLPYAVDHVFEKAPEKIKVFAGALSSSRNQLLDFPC